MLITELEVGAIGTDFSWRTSWRAREDLRRARTRKTQKNKDVSEMYTNLKHDQMFVEFIYFCTKLVAS
jgi:hypothetical protein